MSASKHGAVSAGTPDISPPDVGSTIGPISLHNAIGNAQLYAAKLDEANLRGTNLSAANLTDARGITNEELDQQASSLEEATMPNGQKYEDWLKSKGREEVEENSDP